VVGTNDGQGTAARRRRQLREMGESRARRRGNSEQPANGVIGEAAERDDDPQLRQIIELSSQEGNAAVTLRGRRPVARWRAPHDSADIAADERESVVTVHARRLIRVSGAPQCAVQPVARAVAGKQPSCPVAAVGGGREAEHQQPRSWISESGHRPSPISLVRKRGALLGRDLLAPGDESRACTAALHLVAQSTQSLLR
jgi:hypothetical protein